MRLSQRVRRSGNLKDFVQMHRQQLGMPRVPFLGRVTGHYVSFLQVLLFILAAWI